jgi:hypothetical protein
VCTFHLQIEAMHNSTLQDCRTKRLILIVPQAANTEVRDQSMKVEHCEYFQIEQTGILPIREQLPR